MVQSITWGVKSVFKFFLFASLSRETPPILFNKQLELAHIEDT